MAGKEFGVDVNPLAQELNTSLTLASQDTVPPEQESQLRAASKRLGIPLDSARTLPQETIKAGEQAAFDADDYATRFPTSAKYFADLNNARLSRDDVQPVANLEQSIRQFNKAGIGPSVMGQAVDAGAAMDANNPDKIRQDALAKFGFKGASIVSRAMDKAQADAALPTMQAWDGKTNEFTYGDAVRKGVGTVKLTWDFLADRLAGSLGMDQTETRRILAETSAYIDGLGKDFETELAFERAREGGGGSIVGTIGALGGAVAQSDDPVGIVGKFMTEQLTASLPGAVLGGMAAAPARAAATSYIRNELVAKGVSTALAGAAASATAVVTQSLGSNYKEGIDSGMLPGEAASRAWTKTLAEVPANAIAGAAIGLRIGPNALANVLAQTAIQGVGGGVGAASASLAVGEQIDPLEIALEVVGEAVGAAPDMVIAGATVPQEMQARADAQRRMAERQEQIAQTENNAAQLQSVLAAAAASQTRVRDPESFNQLVQQAAEDSGTAPTELFIDAQPLVEILSQTGMTREQIEQLLPSVVEQLDEALATDGSVVIPVGEAVTAFAGTGFEQELVRNARVDADAISPADAEAAKASLQELDAEAQAIIAEQQEREAWEASAQRVFDDMNRELNAAGRFTPDVNQVYATVVRDFYTVLAGKLGQMPDQVWARYRIPVTATGGRAGAALDQDIAEDSETVYREMAADDDLMMAIESWMVDGDLLSSGQNARLRGFMARMPIVERQFKRGQPAGAKPWDRGWASWSTSDSAEKFFMDSPRSELLTRFSGRGINLEQLGLFYGRRIGAAVNWGLQGEWLLDNGSVFYQSAFHGSPYRFDRFTLDAIGTGEGAQAYGWGLYFAGRREIAEFYRETLSGGMNRMLDNNPKSGVLLQDKSGSGDWSIGLLNNEGTQRGQTSLSSRSIAGETFATIQEAVEFAKANDMFPDNVAFAKYDSDKGTFVPVDSLDDVDTYDQIAAYDKGQLYRVEIPEDDQFLLWDKPLSEQPEKVRQALAKLNIRTPAGGKFVGTKRVNEELTGREAYQLLAGRLSADKAASLALLDLGIAGIKYLDGTSRSAGEGSFNYVVFDDQAVQIAETFYQEMRQPEQGGARAQFNPATLEISLLEKADLSSFLHELGHAFFEITAMVAAQPNAPQTLVDDMQTLFNATGYTGTLQEWLATPVSQRRIAHETVAESFEQYLIDGKAPSLELQSLFERMRTWMLRVYRTLQDFLSRNPNAKLTDEVRGVFDRMLATDEAIAAAKAARAALPLFTSAEQAGMTPEQFADYLRAAGEVDQDAIREVDSRSIRDMKWLRAARDRKLKELQKDAAAKRRNARIEARRQLLQEPVYRTMTFLRGKVEPVPVEKRSGKNLDARRDDLVTAVAKLGGLNKEAAVAEFGIDPADFPTKIVGSPTLRAGKAGKSPDAMAEALAEAGYLQPREGGRYDLRDLGDLLHEAARGVSSYSLQADYDLIYGYKTLPVPGDANENPFGAGRLSLPELTERFAGTDVDFMKLGVGRRGMIAEIGMPMDAVAELVGFKTGEEMVRALLDAEPLQSATEGLTDQIMLERYGDLASDDAIERAADAALANDARTRMVATEFAALNTAVGSVRAVQTAARQTASTVVARQKIRNVRPDKSAAAVARAGKGAEAALRKGDRDTAAGYKRSQVLNAAIEREQRKVRTEIDKAVDDIRAMFGNDKTIAKSRDMNLVNAAREAVARYGLAPEVAGQRADNYMTVLARENPEMADQLEAITSMLPEPKPYRDLTVEEFRGLRDSVLGLYQLARRVMQTRIDGKLVDIDEAATPIVEAVINRNGGELPGLLGYDGTVTDAEKMKNALLGFKAAGMRVEQWSDAMGAEVKRIIYQQVSDAAVQARLVRTDLIKRYRDLIKLIEPGMSYDPINAPELGANGFVFHRGKQELLHALLHTGNASNLRKLLLGRGWAELDAEGNLDTARWDSFLRRMIDEGAVTKADYDFAQGVWDLLESIKKDAQKAHFDIFGFYFNEVTADEIETPFGTYRGGYVPALVDPLSAADQAQKREAEAAAQGGNSYMFPTTGKGFTQARVEYNRPLMLDLRTIASHLDKVTRFTYLEPAVKDAGRLMMNKRVARALNGLDNNLIGKMINPWLQRTAQQTTTVPTRFPKMDQFFRAIRTRSGMYIMFANVINTMQQLTGFSVAAVKVPAPKLLRALKSYTGNPREMTRMAMELSPWLRDRLDRQGFEMTQQIEEILVNPSLYRQSQDFMKRHAYFLQTGLQNVMDVVVWWGAYDQARSTKGVTDKQAVRFADEVIRTTQGTYSPEDVSGIEVQPAFIQLFTQFWGYFNMLANTLGGEVGKTLREMGYMASTPRLLGIWFLGLMIPAFVGQLIAQGAPDDEDDEDGDGTLDEWLAMFFGSQASTLAAMVPVVGQAATLAFNQFDDKVYNDRLNISPALSMVESAAAGVSEILQGEAFDDRLKKAEVRNVAILVALATGMPTNVIAKPLGYELDVQAGKKDPDNAAEYAIGLTTGR